MPLVTLLAGLRDTLGNGDARLRVDASRVAELLETLARNSGDPGAARGLLFGNERNDECAGERALHSDVRVLVNGRSVQFLEGLDTGLRSGDKVTLHLAGMRGFPGG